MERGKLIWYEGGEGSTKTTQLALMEKYLIGKGIKVINAREPGGTPLAEKVRELLLDTKNGHEIETWSEILLFQSARTLLYKNRIIPNLEKGFTVQQDRSGDSSIAYQGYGRRGDINLIKKLNTLSTFGYKPDLTFIIDIDAKKGLEKELDEDRISVAGLEFHKRVNAGYLEIAKENPDNYMIIPWIENGKEEMHELMKKYINKLFKF